jgi:hypothetical protein
MARFADTPAMGRPPLREDQVRDKVLAYCGRYGVSPGPEGLPPFPSGKRESRQHREWLTVYRALRRLRQRAAADPAPSGVLAPGRLPRDADAPTCPVCALVVSAKEAVRLEAPARGSRGRLHPDCADLARLAEKAGPEAVARLSSWLWPRSRGRRGQP